MSPSMRACVCVCARACTRAKLLQSCLTLCNPMDYSPPGASLLGILQQEYWSGLPFPSPGELLNPGIKLHLLCLLRLLYFRQILYH